MFQDILAFIREIDWTGYEVSVFEILLVVFALIKKFNLLSLLILAIVMGKGFIIVQRHTNFSGEFAETVPFIVYSICALIFFVYAMVKLFGHEE